MPKPPKKKRAKQYDPNRYGGGIHRQVDPADVASTDELIRWVDAGAAGRVPTAPLSEAAQVQARRCVKGYAPHRPKDERLGLVFDEFREWLTIGADGLIPAVAPSEFARDLLRSASEGLQLSRAQRVRA